VPYVELDGIASYHEIHGTGEPVLMLHGGFCSIETMQPQIDALATAYRVHAPERPGQGRTADRPGPISFEQMVSDTVAYLDALGVPAAHVIGFSDGAITGLLLARDHPDRVLSLVSISANLDPDGFVADEETVAGDLGEEPAPSEENDDDEWGIRDAYARLAPGGAAQADVVLEKLVEMWRSEPQIDPASLSSVRAPTMVLAGQHDSIRTDHTLSIAQAISDAQVAIVPGAGHMVMLERAELVNLLLREFLASASPPG